MNADTTMSARYCDAITIAAGTGRDPTLTSVACTVRLNQVKVEGKK